MPSWTEKPVAFPTINVNLKPCDCDGHIVSGGDDVHAPDCAGRPVLIPCPLPRSVAFTVRLGECTCALSLTPQTAPEWHHTSRCPARPIRVSCSISGKTWGESEVDDCEQHGLDDFAHDGLRIVARDMCRERWALVKALLGVNPSWTQPGRWFHKPERMALFAQRDAVFAALADMRRTEIAGHEAFLRLPLDLREVTIIKRDAGMVAGDPRDGGIDLPSARIFARYIARLVEQVGAL